MKIGIITVSNSELVSSSSMNILSQICSSLYKNKQDVLLSNVVKSDASNVGESIKYVYSKCDATILICENEWDKFYMCKKLLCDLFNCKIENNEFAKKNIDEYAKEMNVPLQKEDASLSQMPEIARTIKNPFSAYQGCLCEKDDKLLFMLPLEERELYHVFFSSVLPFIISNNKEDLKDKTYILRTFGIKLSDLRHLIRDEIRNKYSIEIICSEKLLRGEIIIKIKGGTRSDAQKNIVSKVYSKLLPYFYSERDESLEEFIYTLLSIRKLKLSFAEDFTAGALTTSLYENLENANEIISESIIATDDTSKVKLLGVEKSIFKKSSIDYSELAYQMALGILENSGADIVVSSCGDIKEGLLTFAIGNAEGIHVFNEKVSGGLQEKIKLATGMIFFHLIKKIKQDDFHIGNKTL